MQTVLHILTRADDELATEVIRRQEANPQVRLKVSNLTTDSPDYSQLLEDIFTADSVEVW